MKNTEEKHFQVKKYIMDIISQLEYGNYVEELMTMVIGQIIYQFGQIITNYPEDEMNHSQVLNAHIETLSNALQDLHTLKKTHEK